MPAGASTFWRRTPSAGLVTKAALEEDLLAPRQTQNPNVQSSQRHPSADPTPPPAHPLRVVVGPVAATRRVSSNPCVPKSSLSWRRAQLQIPDHGRPPR